MFTVCLFCLTTCIYFCFLYTFTCLLLVYVIVLFPLYVYTFYLPIFLGLVSLSSAHACDGAAKSDDYILVN